MLGSQSEPYIIYLILLLRLLFIRAALFGGMIFRLAALSMAFITAGMVRAVIGPLRDFFKASLILAFNSDFRRLLRRFLAALFR
ncbi:MAG: hypothetical protein WD940_00640 [Patescibacteria group bacterium]